MISPILNKREIILEMIIKVIVDDKSGN